MPGSTPEDSITGRKNIARTSVRPLNFWFSSTATTKLSDSVASTFTAMRPISCTRYWLK